ncbi:hypothetical protein [Microvirga sp. Mcv34]|nr:hypothetical protein [Microvirga sp. Mcv34]
MNDDDPFLEASKTTPATDTLARILRWVGLLAGIGLCAWAISTVL